MANSNMPILWQNALSGVQTEIGRKAWIWFAETRGQGMLYDADKYAWEVDKIVLSLRPMIEASSGVLEGDGLSVGGETIDDLMRFILTRHANNIFGGNVKPNFLM